MWTAPWFPQHLTLFTYIDCVTWCIFHKKTGISTVRMSSICPCTKIRSRLSMTAKVGDCWKLSLFTLQQLIEDQAFPSLIILILMTFTLKPPPPPSLQSCREARLKGARLAHYFACLCNDWSGAGLQATIGWPARRNSDYSEVVMLVVVVVLALFSLSAHCLGSQSW